MGNETRIGIVAGLVIVVVASLYFFYGNSHKDDDLLLTTGDRVAAPPQIPVSAEKKTAPPAIANRNRPVQRPISPALPVVSDRLANRDARPATRPPLTTHFMGPPTAPSSGIVGSPLANGPSASPSPAPLRTGPSPALSEAVRENLRRAEQPAGANATPGPLAAGPTAPNGSFSPTGNRTGLSSANTNRPVASPSHPNAKPLDADLPVVRGAARPVDSAAEKSNTDESTTREPTSTEPTGKTYKVKSGDTFYAIAKRVYGSGKRWEEIYMLNKDVVHGDPKRLSPGMTLKLPK